MLYVTREIRKHIKQILRARHVEWMSQIMQEPYTPNVPYIVLTKSRFSDFAWFFDNGFASVNHTTGGGGYANPSTRLLHDAIFMENAAQKMRQKDWRDKLRYLINHHDIDIEATSEIGENLDAETPLLTAFSFSCDYATKLLLLAGASTATLSEYCISKLQLEWLSGKRVCALAVTAFLIAMKRKGMPKDVRLLLAHIVWQSRYNLDWYGEEERLAMHRLE